MLEIEKKFLESREVKNKIEVLEKEFYAKKVILDQEYEDIEDEMIDIRFAELGIEFRDKVETTTGYNESQGYIVSAYLRQKPNTFSNKNITFDDFEIIGEFKAINKDGSMGKRDALVLNKVENIKKCDY